MSKNGFSGKIFNVFFVIGLCLFTANTLYGQNAHTGSIVFDEDGFSFDIRVLYTPVEMKTLPKVNYSWYRNGSLKSTMGDYSGNLLHGKYEKFDSYGNLLVKGDFQYGVKNGQWKYWDSLGVIHTEETWKKGFLLQRISVDKDIITLEPFKNNRLHGKVIKKRNDELVSSLKYRKGEQKTEERTPLFSGLKNPFRKNKNKTNDPEEEIHPISMQN